MSRPERPPNGPQGYQEGAKTLNTRRAWPTTHDGRMRKGEKEFARGDWHEGKRSRGKRALAPRGPPRGQFSKKSISINEGDPPRKRLSQNGYGMEERSRGGRMAVGAVGVKATAFDRQLIRGQCHTSYKKLHPQVPQGWSLGQYVRREPSMCPMGLLYYMLFRSTLVETNPSDTCCL